MGAETLKLSILIPAYNAENYILRCLNSVVEQSHQLNTEIVVIDDGSNDNTKQLVQNFGVSHKQVRLFSIQNQGVYKARNYGLTKVTGDYVWMLDADDYIDKDAFRVLHEALKTNDRIDVFHFGYKQEKNKNKFKAHLPCGKHREIIDGLEHLNRNDGRLYLWNNLYKVSFLKNNNLKFLAKSISLEDSLFNLQVFSKAKKVMLIKETLYYYLININSISRTKTKEHLLRQGESSINVHLETKTLKHQYDKNSKGFKVIQERLDHSILGFFYSLYIEKYPLEYIQHIFKLYKNERLLPVHKKTKQFKLKIFQMMINQKWPFVLLCQLNRR